MLDGQLQGHSENMFRPATFDLTGRLETGAELLIYSGRRSLVLAPRRRHQPATAARRRLAAIAPEEAAEDGEEVGVMPPTLPLARLRRQGNLLVGLGLRPAVALNLTVATDRALQESGAVLTGHHVRTDRVDVGNRTAELTVRIEATQLQQDLRLMAEVELVSPSSKIDIAHRPAGGGRRDGGRVAQAQHRYRSRTPNCGGRTTSALNLATRPLSGCETANRSSTSGATRSAYAPSPWIAVRIPRADATFRFVLNGVPIFARGAAWLPADMLVGSVSDTLPGIAEHCAGRADDHAPHLGRRHL